MKILSKILNMKLEVLTSCVTNPDAMEAAYGTLEYMEAMNRVARRNFIVAYVAVWIVFIMYLFVEQWLGISWVGYIFRLALMMSIVYGAAGIARLF